MTDNIIQQSFPSHPHTPIGKGWDYLPSPPISPACKRSIRRENFFQFKDIDEFRPSSQSDISPPVPKVPGGRKPGRPRTTTKSAGVARITKPCRSEVITAPTIKN